MSAGLLLLFCRKELRDLRGNRQVWPGYLLLPIAAVVLPVVLVALVPIIADPASAAVDPSLRSLWEYVERDRSLAGDSLVERLARLIIRDFGLWYLLMPIALASGPAGLSIVREKEQRTLEPILATPIGDRELVLAKLAGALGPALLWTWTAGAAGYGVSAAAAAVLVGPLVLPTLGNVVGLLLLGPVLAAVAALGGIGVSARFTDSQSANLFTGLVVVPLTLILLGLVGRPAMANPLVGLVASGLGIVVCALLFERAVRRLQREELLTRWR